MAVVGRTLSEVDVVYGEFSCAIGFSGRTCLDAYFFDWVDVQVFARLQYPYRI